MLQPSARPARMANPTARSRFRTGRTLQAGFQADRAGVGVGRGAEARRAAVEDLVQGGEPGVDLEVDVRAWETMLRRPFGRCRPGLWRCSGVPGGA